jgi:hypothetical protein
LQGICPRTPLGWAFLMPKSPAGAQCQREESTAGEVSRGLAMIGLQQSAQTLNADDLTLVTFVLGLDDLVEALVYLSSTNGTALERPKSASKRL